jgi:glycosyltransferase involved in cell wall biosynthesis
VRILIVTPRDPRTQGGVERHVAEVARRHAAAGHEVTVLCGDAEGNAPRAESYEGYEIRVLRAHPRGRDWFLVPSLPREIRRARPEIVHVQSYHTLVPPLAMARALALRVPYVLTFHGGGHSSGVRNRARTAQRRLQRPLLARAAKLVAVARFEIEEYGRELRLGPEHFALIPNGTDLNFAAGEPDRSGPPTVASVGRLESYKGHHRVIEAFPETLRRRPDARLQIVGSGPYEGELHALVARLGLGERVEITSVPPDRPAAMAELLRKVWVFALLSEFETHPIAAVEAAASGCRLVVADVGGTKELADAGLARPVPLGAPAEEVGAVLAEELEGPAQSARPDVLGWDECAALLIDLYRSILERTNA